MAHAALALVGATWDQARTPAPGRGGESPAADEVLVWAAQYHDAAAFGRLYDRYFDQVYRSLAFRVRDTQDCEDLAAQVILKALEALGAYRSQGLCFSAWLVRIAHNLAVDYWRRRPHRRAEALERTCFCREVGRAGGGSHA